jgi:hypothetical protein
MNNQ